MARDANLRRLAYTVRAIFFRWSGFVIVFYGVMLLLGFLMALQNLLPDIRSIKVLPMFALIPVLAIWYGSVLAIIWHGVRGVRRTWSAVWGNYTNNQRENIWPLNEDQELKPLSTTDIGSQDILPLIGPSIKFTFKITLLSFLLVGIIAHASLEWGLRFSSPVLAGISDLILFFAPIPENTIRDAARVFYSNPDRTLVRLTVSYSTFAGFVSTPCSNNLIMVAESFFIRGYAKGGHLRRFARWIVMISLTVILFLLIHNLPSS